MGITLEARAKINWALDITGIREDGYHMLNMLMHQIELSDTLSVEEAGEVSLRVDGVEDPEPERNLVVRAARALNAHTGQDRGARIELTKCVPARAGLGGGSADCAAALLALNELWGLHLPEATLLAIGAKLGADVPFCLAGGLARVSGIGEVIEHVPGAPRIPLVLVTPGGGLSTAEVFRLWDQGNFPRVSLDVHALADAVTRCDLPAVDRLCANALTAPAIRLMPEIDLLIRRMRELGAGAAFMTGSGSTVVGAFADDAAARSAAAAIPGATLTHTVGR